jgi:type I restriction enzyme R subunit
MNYGVDSNEFQNYYKDLAKRVKGKDSHNKNLPSEEKVDLLIVVGMFLTGFDAPALNTIFVDKNLRYHGLIQAFSRTNRIYDATKTFGNIVTFRDLEKATIDAITLFGDSNTKNVVLEKSYKEYLEGFTDIASGEARKGYIEVVKELNEKFPKPDEIVKEKDKKEFSKLFGEYLRVENILQNYDEFNNLKAFQAIEPTDRETGGIALKTLRGRRPFWHHARAKTRAESRRIPRSTHLLMDFQSCKTCASCASKSPGSPQLLHKH